MAEEREGGDAVVVDPAGESTENPLFGVKPRIKMKEGDEPAEAEVMLREIQVAHAALGLRMQELEKAVREQQGVVEATPVDEDGTDASENTGLLVYASNAARHVFAQKVTAPACFHQVTTVYLLDDAQPMTQKMLFLFSSVALLLLQTMTLHAVAGGVSAPSCVHNPDCPYGSFCSVLEGRKQGYCSTCLMKDGVTPRLTGAVLSSPTPGAAFLWVDARARNASRFCAGVGAADGWVDTADGAFCQACYDDDLPGNHWNIGQTMTDKLQDATLRMRGGDWAAMALVACVVGLYCAGELRDIKLCQLTFEQRDGASAPAWVRGVLFVLIALRQYSVRALPGRLSALSVP